MQALKENLPAIAVGVIAAGISAYIAFGGKNDKKKNEEKKQDNEKSQKVEEVLEEVQETLDLEFFFVVSNL